MAYVPVPPIMTAPGAPIIESLALRTRDNPLAVAAGDVSVPLASRVNLALALRTPQLDQTRVLQANGAQGWQWGAPSRGLRVEIRTASGTWVVPAGVTRIEVELWGAGGGSDQTPFTCGGSGAYVRAVLPVAPGETLDFTVGVQNPNSPGGLTQISNAGNTVQAIANGGNVTTGAPTAASTGSVVGGVGAALIRVGRRSRTATAGGLQLSVFAPFSMGRSGTGAGYGAGGQPNASNGHLRWKYYGT